MGTIDSTVSLETVVSTISAVAAVTAALFAGLAWRTGVKTAERAWTRQALVDAYVDFIEQDLRGTSIAAALLRSRFGLPAPSVRTRLATDEAMRQAHNRTQELMTRARILGGTPVNDALHKTHKVFDEYLALLADPTGEVDEESLETLRRRSVAAYDDLIVAVRSELGIRGKPWQWISQN